MKKLFIYYSLTGNGDEVAKIYKKKNYDIRKVKVKKSLPNKMFFKLMVGGFKALIGYKEKLIDFDNTVGKYDEIVIGSPVWFDRLCSPIRTVLSKIDFGDKKVSFVLYSGSGKGDKATEFINKNYPKSKVVILKEPKKNSIDKEMLTL